MESNMIMTSMEMIAGTLEVVGVAGIAFCFPHALLRGALHYKQGRDNVFKYLKIYIGKVLQLALEFFVAADIIRTVTSSLTLESLAALGLLILVRTMLSWSITMEMEGCWPWQVAKIRTD